MKNLEAKVYTMEGKEKTTIALPETLFGVAWNADLVHQTIQAYRNNMRSPVAHTKDRSEVSGGGKKPWQQKGTGRARHGSRRSPIWVGGGIAHGPRKDKDFSRKINKKMKQKALATILSKKFEDGEVFFIDALSFKEPKTKEARTMLTNLEKNLDKKGLASKRRNVVCIEIPGAASSVTKSFQNIGNVKVEEIRNLNPLTAITYKYLLIAAPEESIKVISK